MIYVPEDSILAKAKLAVNRHLLLMHSTSKPVAVEADGHGTHGKLGELALDT
jgi:hypothetical protein